MSVVVEASTLSPFRALGRVTALPGFGCCERVRRTVPMKVAERPTRAPCVAPRGDTGRGVFIDHAGHGRAVTRPITLNGEEVDASMTTDTAVP